MQKLKNLWLIVFVVFSVKELSLAANNDSIPRRFYIIAKDALNDYDYRMDFQYVEPNWFITHRLMPSEPFVPKSSSYLLECDFRNGIKELKEGLVHRIESVLGDKEMNGLKSIKIVGSSIFHPYLNLPNLLKILPEKNDIEQLQIVDPNYEFSIGDEISRCSKLKKIIIDIRKGVDETITILDTTGIRAYKELRHAPNFSDSIQYCSQLELLSVKGFFTQLPKLKGLKQLKSLEWTQFEMQTPRITPIESTNQFEVNFDALKKASLTLPEEWKELQKLERLKIYNAISQLPKTYKTLKNLKEVSLINYEKEFPSTIWTWKKLEQLDLSIPNVRSIKGDFSSLSQLKDLNLHSAFSKLPKGFWKFDSLERLTLITPKMRLIKLDGSTISKKLEYLNWGLEARSKSSIVWLGDYIYRHQPKSFVRKVCVKNAAIPIELSGTVIPVLKKIHVQKCSDVWIELGTMGNSQIGLRRLNMYALKKGRLKLLGNATKLSVLNIDQITDVGLIELTGSLNKVRKLSIRNSAIVLLQLNIEINLRRFNIEIDNCKLLKAKYSSRQPVHINLSARYHQSNKKQLERLINSLKQIKNAFNQQETVSVITLRINNYKDLDDKTKKTVQSMYKF